MSNAIRTGKRTLAGVAVGALGLALIPFVGVTSANAAVTAASVSPVRYVGATTTVQAVPAAYVSWSNAVNGVGNGTTPKVYFTGTNVAGGNLFVSTAAGVDDSTLTVGTNAVLNADQLGAGVPATGSTDDSYIRIKAGGVGSYTGLIADGSDTVSFAFTTTGTVATMALTPATQATPVGGTATLALTLKDAAGNVTQPDNTGTVALSQTGAGGTLSATSVAATDQDFGRGLYGFTVSAMAAGTTNVAGTGSGSLLTINAAAVAITTSGAIASTGIRNAAFTAPANVINIPAVTTDDSSRVGQVPAGTTTVTLTVDDTTANPAGTVLRFSAAATAGTVNGASTAVTPVYTNVTTDANKQATLTYTLGGAATLAGASLTINQVNAANTPVTGTTSVVTQKQPTVVAADITVSPDDSVLAALGATTSVTVTVDDSFGTPQTGWTVSAFRIGTATALSSGVTNTSGEATVSVTNAATTLNNGVEQYTFTATPPVGAVVTKTNALQITYTTSGAVSTMSVTTSGTGTTNPTNAAPTLAIVPLVTVPSSGVVNSTVSAGAWTLATSLPTAAPTGSVATFTVTTTPANSVTVTVPVGLKVSATAPTAATLWSAGAQSAVINGAAGIAYVWGTKTGLQDVTITSGGVTVVAQVFVANTSADAYNIALAPTSQNVVRGGIGTATLTVTDVFGNPVQTSTGATATDDTGLVAIGASGEILLAGFVTSANLATNAQGTATVTFIAGNANGEGNLTAVPANATSTSKAPAWRPLYTPPTGAPAPVTSAAAAVVVGDGPATNEILISGFRGGAADRTIFVEGLTTGLPEGTVVRPWIKFPGQTTYSQGVASRSVALYDVDDLLGDFAWQRQTGKKTYVYFRTEDGTEQSLRIIIPAR